VADSSNVLAEIVEERALRRRVGGRRSRRADAIDLGDQLVGRSDVSSRICPTVRPGIQCRARPRDVVRLQIVLTSWGRREPLSG